MGLHEYTVGVKSPSGFQVQNPFPVDSWSGPYSAGNTTDAISLAYSTIPGSVRFLSMEVRILVPNPSGGTLAYKYWFRGSTATLEEFSAGGGGASFDSSQSYNWTAPQYFSSGFSAAGGVTFTTPVSFLSGFSAGGGVTFTSLARFTAGLSASGITAGNIRTTYLRASNVFGISPISTTSLCLASNFDLGEGASSIIGIYSGTESLDTAIYTSVPHFGSSSLIRTNLAMGSNSLVNLNTTATNINNVAFGASAGYIFWDGTPNLVSLASNSVFLGAASSPKSNNETNQIVIGYNSLGDGSNTTVIGNSNTTSTRVYGLLSTNGGVSAAGATFGSLVRALGGISASGATLGTLVVNSGISAGGGATFGGLVRAVNGISASGATLGTLVVNSGISASGGVTFGGLVRAVNGISASGATLGTLVVNSGISASGGVTFSTLRAGNVSGNNQFIVEPGVVVVNGLFTVNNEATILGGISASGATLGTLVVNRGISANGGVTFGNNVYVGGTLSVEGNFYVAGTLTTVNESQLLIQDKYLVLGSTLTSGEFGVSAGIYIGSTTSPIASFAYSNDGGGRWVSNKPIYVNSNEVLTSANLSIQTGLTAESLNVLATSDTGTYFLPLIPGSSNNTAYRTYVDIGITYDAVSNTLSCTKIEAIIDGGTWTA